MALKNFRNVVADNIEFYMDEVAEAGGVVCLSTVGSGEASDQSEALVTYAASPSGKLPVGLLAQDMVNKDLSQTHLNYYKREVQKGGKVDIVTQGTFVTNMVYPGQTPAVNKTAYLSHSGYLAVTDLGDRATPVVGVWLSSKDADGYAKVSINLPMATPRL